MGKAMAPLQVNKLASTEDSASAKSLKKKWPSRITSLLNIAVEKDKKNCFWKVQILGKSLNHRLSNTNNAPNSSVWPREENTGNRYMYLSVEPKPG